MTDRGKTIEENPLLISSSPLHNTIGGLEEDLGPLASSSPILCRKFGRRKKRRLSSDQRFGQDSPKRRYPPDSHKKSLDESRNDCSLLIKDDSFVNHINCSQLIKDDSFISHINFEQLDQLSANGGGHLKTVPETPESPQLFEDPSSVKNFESQCSSHPTQASLSSTLSSQPLVTRIQRSFKSKAEAGQVKCEDERRSEEVAAALEESAHTSRQSFSLGPFFGLSSRLMELLRTHRGITKLYKWQEDCINKGAASSNLLISMPTSGGKTLVAEVLVWQQLLLKNHDALFVLPYVALVQEKVRDLAPFGVELDFLVEEYASSRGMYPPTKHKKHVVYVATIEKAYGLVNSLLSEGRGQELGLVVVDEVHMVGETGGRGATLENLLTTLRFSAAHVQLVAMSATVGNLEELARFLNAEIYENNFRPVQLVEYIMMDQQVCQVNKAAKAEGELFINKRTIHYNSQKQIGALVEELVPEHSCLVFCPTKNWCENEALGVCKFLPRKLRQFACESKRALMCAIQEEGGESICPVLRRTLPYGVAYHHSGLTDGERHLVEEAYLHGTICVIFCTSTLAAGINLPARRVIIRSPYTGRAFLTQSRYKQMVGRAGRTGLSTCGESFLITERMDLHQVVNMLLSSIEKCISTLTQDDHHGLVTLLFSSIGLGMAVSLAQLREQAGLSLMALQASELTVNVSAKVSEIVEQLRDMDLVRIKEENETLTPTQRSLSDGSGKSSKKSSKISSTPVLERLSRPVEDTDTLTVSRLGKAAIKGNIKYTIAKQLYKDLLDARDNLSVNTYLHLIHLVIPYESVSTVQIIPKVFNKAYSMLGKEELKLADALHINEGVIVRMISGRKVKNVTEEVLKRFYSAVKLHVIWSVQGVWEASKQLGCERGELQMLLNSTTAFASCVSHFCAEMEELWAFRDLLVNITQILSGCCAVELLPLLDLPSVKKGRAKMLYKAGLKTLKDVARSEPRVLMQAVTHLSHRTAREIINSAKMLLIDKAETLQMEAEEMITGLSSRPTTPEVLAEIIDS